VDEKQVLVPSRRLETKWRVIAWIVFAFIAPFALLGLVRGLGWTYVWLFAVANAAWMAVIHVLIGPYFRSLSYELGDEAVTVQRGLLTTLQNTVPYRMVTNVTLKRDFLDRRLGLGSLHIHTAGYGQQANAEARLVGLENYQQVYADLMVALHRHRPQAVGNGTMRMGDRPSSGVNLAFLLRQVLDELQALRLERQDHSA